MFLREDDGSDMEAGFDDVFSRLEEQGNVEVESEDEQ